MKSLRDSVAEYISAGFAGIWIQSHEHDEACKAIAEAVAAHNKAAEGVEDEPRWIVAEWDIVNGVDLDDKNVRDPLAAVSLLEACTRPDQRPVIVYKNLHLFVQDPVLLQACANQILKGERDGATLIVLAPVVRIPLEIEKLFAVLEHELPDKSQLGSLAKSVADGEPDWLPKNGAFDSLLDAAGGLTRYEAKGAFSLSIRRKGKIDKDAVWELKTGALKKTGTLSLYRGGETFDDLGGLASVKEFCQMALRPDRPKHLKQKGIMILGVPGSGKSAVAKALGNQTGRPTIRLDVGALFGGLVGESEERTRDALAMTDRMAPAVLWIDEVEKAFGGSGASGSNDGGVGKRMFGSFLTWLNDHESDVFVVCTANDITHLPGEFLREGRFHGIFFSDLPGAEQRDMIWKIYGTKHGIDVSERPDDANWTGAEIAGCCEKAVCFGIPVAKAAKYVVPIAISLRERIDFLREKANGRWLSTEYDGWYVAGKAEKMAAERNGEGAKQRRVSRV